MVKVDYEPSEVLISPREPYDKKTLWIHPKDDNIEIKIYDKGWKVISLTKDKGLSDEAKKLVETINLQLKNLLLDILKKLFGKFSSNSTVILERQRALEERIKNIEDKFDKLNKKYSIIRNGK